MYHLLHTNPHVQHPEAGVPNRLSDRIADRVAAWFGSMTCFYVLVVWMLGWMALATAGFWLFGNDPAPFAVLLFLSNLVQLWALPILGTATNRADQKRQAKADADHCALTHIANRVDEISELIRDFSHAL